MSTLRVDTITDEAGTGPVSFPNGVTGVALFATSQVLTASKTLTSADDKNLIISEDAITITLPALEEGLVFGICNTSSETPIVVITPVTTTMVGQYEGGITLDPINEAIFVCNGTSWNLIGAEGRIRFSVQQFSASGTYIAPANAAAILCCVNGATGSTKTSAYQYSGGSGGGGYSEKLLTPPYSSPYTVLVGAAGSEGGTGGTTSIDTISIPSSAGVTSATGSAGGVGSGGDFNATGGSGGDGAQCGGGGGGSATRAGNGGDATNANAGSWGGGGGGTGGNDASDFTAGAAATSVSGSAYSLASLITSSTFSAGLDGSSQHGGSGASSYNPNEGLLSIPIGNNNAGRGTRGYYYSISQAYAGQRGHITIVEFY